MSHSFSEAAICLYDISSAIVFHRDPKISPRFYFALFERVGTRLAMSSANHTQSEAQIERMVRTLRVMPA